MKWLVLALALFNLGLAAYLYLDQVRGSPDGALLRQQLNPDEIRVLPEAPPPPPVPSRGACLEWRSFAAAELPRARQALAGFAQQARVSEREVLTPVRWWVHIPPQGSEAAMERKTRELRRLGVAEFHPNVEPGRWRYAISLGLFRSEEAARAYLETLQKKGVRSAVITEREQRITQTAFVIRGASAEESSHLRELSTRYPGTELATVDCPA